MIEHLQNYYLQLPEPAKSCVLAVRDYVLAYDPDISEAWKYRVPFFYYRGKMVCYLNTLRPSGQPYLGAVQGKHIDHPRLQLENRARVKYLHLDPRGDLPIEVIDLILERTIAHYRA